MQSKPDFVHPSVWTRPPRGRSGQPTLSREQIVKAAIEILDADGLDGLSMRRLGSKLGSGATSLYWHVAHKEELLELVVDEALGEVYVPEAGDARWRISISVWADAMRTMLLRHPWMIGLLGSKPTLGPNAMRNGDRMVVVLDRAGFSGLELSHVNSMISAHTLGAAAIQTSVSTALKKAGVPANEMVQNLQPYLESIADEVPNYDRWRREAMPADYDPEAVWEESFAFGLERMLDGLELWLTSGKPAAKKG